MLQPERYFDDIYSYIDLWSGGYVKAYLPDLDGQAYDSVKERFAESIFNRIDVINKIRNKMGLDDMTVDASYDYYVNNMPEFNESNNEIELENYDQKTLQLESNSHDIVSSDENIAKAHLIVMGAPEFFIKNSDVMQRRINQVNRLLKEGGYPKMSAKKTEKLLMNILVVNSI